VARRLSSDELTHPILQAVVGHQRPLRHSGGSAANAARPSSGLMASEMRHRLVDHARRRLADKQGAGLVVPPLDAATPGIIKREWVFARAWLAAAMAQPSFPG
jgi:hypothetical protein